MTDRDLAVAHTHAADTERQARAQWESACVRLDSAERDAAIGVMRQAIGLKRLLEHWITARAHRAAHQTTT